MASVGRLVKETAVEELTAKLAGRSNFLVTTVNRRSAPTADALRQKLYGSSAHLILVKRTLCHRLMDRLNVAGVTELFEGSVGLVLPGEDVLLAARVIVEFVKTHEEQLAVRGGFIDGMLLDKRRIEELASLPPRPVLLAQVLAAVESTLADVMFTIERLIGDVAWTAEQAATKKPQPAAAVEGQAGTTPTPHEETASTISGAAAQKQPASEPPSPEQKPTTQETQEGAPS